jgi:lysozyme
MKPRYQATRAAVDLIKRFEGFRPKAAQLPDGSWTIGYGHTRSARQGAEITEADADALLIYDMAAVTAAINEWVFSPLTQHQFDALAAFVFNIGLQNFRRSSVLRRLNEGSTLQAACAMEMWRTADFEGERIVVDALVRRRSAEMALFLTPMEGHIPVPSLVVLPRVDEQQAMTVPTHSTEVETPLDTAIAAAVRHEEAEPASAAVAAAAAITARLNSLLQGETAAPEALPEPEPEPEPEPGPEPELRGRIADEEPVLGAPLPPAEEMALEIAAEPVEPAAEEDPVVAAFRPELVPNREPDAGPAFQGPPHVDPRSPPPPLMFRAPSTLPFARRARKKRANAPALVLMGLTGLGVAGAGPIWGFSANAPGHAPIVPDAEIAGMGVCLVGVGLLAASVYMLLARLAGQND